MSNPDSPRSASSALVAGTFGEDLMSMDKLSAPKLPTLESLGLALQHYELCRATVGLAWPKFCVTRTEVEAATAGRSAAGPATESLIDDLATTAAALAVIDARRDAAGNLTPDDVTDYLDFAARIPPALRRLGLTPVPIPLATQAA